MLASATESGQQYTASILPSSLLSLLPSKCLAVKGRNGNNFHVAQSRSVYSTEGGASGRKATIRRNLQGTCFSRVRREKNKWATRSGPNLLS